MDSTENGHSEKNQPKSVEDFLRLIQQGDFKKIRVDELPFKEQETLREFMEMIGDEEEPELFIADFTMQVDDLGMVPLDILAEMYKDAIMEDDFEDAIDIGKELKNRGYRIDISDESVTFTKTMKLGK